LSFLRFAATGLFFFFSVSLCGLGGVLRAQRIVAAAGRFLYAKLIILGCSCDMTNPAKIDLAHTIFQSAEQFKLAYSTLQQANTGALNVPMTVYGALALELYLKSLIVLEEKEPPYIHDAVKLFNELKPETQKRISGHYDKRTPGGLETMAKARPELGLQHLDFSFDAVLAASGDAFVKFRYIYEGKLSEKNWYAGPIVDAVIATIKEDQPTWFK
jgi:hypothetical protein